MSNEAVVSSKQFHYCNAFVNEICYEKTHCTIYEFVSFCTPVARVKRRKKGTFDAITEITLAPAARCSVTTCKQVSRFLREYTGVTGETVYAKFYELNGIGYHCSNFVLSYSTLFDTYSIKKLIDFEGTPRHLVWFYQSFKPWNGYYNRADIWVNGQHGEQV